MRGAALLQSTGAGLTQQIKGRMSLVGVDSRIPGRARCESGHEESERISVARSGGCEEGALRLFRAGCKRAARFDVEGTKPCAWSKKRSLTEFGGRRLSPFEDDDSRPDAHVCFVTHGSGSKSTASPFVDRGAGGRAEPVDGSCKGRWDVSERTHGTRRHGANAV